MAFAQLLATFVDQEADVGKVGGFPAKGVVDVDVFWGGDEPFLVVWSVLVVLRRGVWTYAAADDVGDVHEVVVDDVGKVVRREAV